MFIAARKAINKQDEVQTEVQKHFGGQSRFSLSQSASLIVTSSLPVIVIMADFGFASKEKEPENEGGEEEEDNGPAPVSLNIGLPRGLSEQCHLISDVWPPQ